MKRAVYVVLAACAAALYVAPASAQEEQADDVYVYATYYMCDVNRQDRVDEIVAALQKPIYDDAVAEGRISVWGWLAHHTGGKWRRLFYFGAPSVDGLMDAQAALADEAAEADESALEEMGAICNSHQDYVWAATAGSADAARGEVGLSVYYNCQGVIGHADDIVENYFGPTLDGYIEDGTIASWGWLSHLVGGHYDRVLNLTSSDVNAVLAAMGRLTADLWDQNGTAMAAFGNICTTHEDYLWETRH